MILAVEVFGIALAVRRRRSGNADRPTQRQKATELQVRQPIQVTESVFWELIWEPSQKRRQFLLTIHVGIWCRKGGTIPCERFRDHQ